MTRKNLTPLILPADPVDPLEAATKQYVDYARAGVQWSSGTGSPVTSSVVNTTNLITEPRPIGGSNFWKLWSNVSTTATSTDYSPPSVQIGSPQSIVKVTPLAAAVGPGATCTMCCLAGTSAMPVTANTLYTFSVYGRHTSTGAAPYIYMRIQYADSAGTNIGSTINTTGPQMTTTGWTRGTQTLTTPSNAAYAQVWIGTVGLSDTNPFYLACAMYAVDTTGAAPPYFDGRTKATSDYSYKWTGTVNNSTSQQLGSLSSPIGGWYQDTNTGQAYEQTDLNVWAPRSFLPVTHWHSTFAGSTGVEYGVQHVTSSTTPSLSDSTWTTVAGWSGGGAGGRYTGGSTAGVSTFNVSGMYLFNATIQFGGSATGHRSVVALHRNGVEQRRAEALTNINSVTVVSIQHMMPMVSGDGFSVVVWVNTTGISLGGTPGHFWQAWRIGDATAYA